MEKSHIAIIAIVVVAIIAIIIAVMGTSNPVVEVPSTQSAEEFYELVLETQKLLDNYADDIYGCWYDYVYEDEYSSVNSALNDAYRENIDNINVIKSNNEKIKELYQNAKEGDLNSEVKKVMQAYNDYYSFVMEVSGSFNSFSANKETLKKDLASALKNLYFELE